MPVEKVEQVAAGRVWTGAQARQHGLVDALGGLDRAIVLAKERAGIPAATEVEVVNYPPRKTLAEMLVEQLTGSGTDRQMDVLFSIIGGRRIAERRAFGVLTAPARLFHPGEPLALMPVSFLR
jgi:ClpP class serine protease